jgi:hypothetical protein
MLNRNLIFHFSLCFEQFLNFYVSRQTQKTSQNGRHQEENAGDESREG